MKIQIKSMAIAVALFIALLLATGCTDGAEHETPQSDLSATTVTDTTAEALSEPRIVKPLPVEENSSSECNHSFIFGANYLTDKDFSCKKCGYSIIPQKPYDCDASGHVIVDGYYLCVLCDAYLDYQVDDLLTIAYKEATETCDGVIQFTDASDTFLLVRFIPAGHGHTNEAKYGGTGGYYCDYITWDQCLEGEVIQVRCYYCMEALAEPYRISEGEGYHISPMVVVPAEPQASKQIAHMKCEFCGREYDCELPTKIELSGVKKKQFTTTEYSYIDSEDYVILLDKDIKLPGDFELIIADTIKEIRNQTGLLSDNWTMPAWSVGNDMRIYLGVNYWEGIPNNGRIIINCVVDREGIGYISCAVESSVNLVEYDFFGDEFWNSSPVYKDDPWRRNMEPDYGAIFHELTHAITLRTIGSVYMGRILTEGIAQYIAGKIDRLYLDEGRAGYVGSYYLTYDQTDFYVTPENAEQLFRNDYQDLSYADRGAEYDYGKYFCEFLEENYGSDYFVKMCNAFEQIPWSEQTLWGEANEEDRDYRTEAVKKLFGDDVFVKFGQWFSKVKKN